MVLVLVRGGLVAGPLVVVLDEDVLVAQVVLVKELQTPRALSSTEARHNRCGRRSAARLDGVGMLLPTLN